MIYNTAYYVLILKILYVISVLFQILRRLDTFLTMSTISVMYLIL